MSLREAVATSRNIPAVLMAERLGYTPLQEFYHQIGLEKALALPSTALGAFEASPLRLADSQKRGSSIKFTNRNTSAVMTTKRPVGSSFSKALHPANKWFPQELRLSLAPS
jgi:hypothetical protein